MGAYIKRTVRAGKVIEVEKYYAPTYGRNGRRRAPRTAPTPEDVARVNEKNAVNRLRWLLNANFRGGDLHAVLTYRRDDRPDVEAASRAARADADSQPNTPQEENSAACSAENIARARLQKALRILRKTARASGTVLKYVHATEYKRRAIHHHLIVSGVTLDQLQDAWPWGRIHATPLDASGEYGTLAAYIVKETRTTFRDGAAPFAKRWCASRNLVQPEIKTEVVHAESWRKLPRAPRGYILVPDSVEVGVHEVTGQPWQRYWMRKIE